MFAIVASLVLSMAARSAAACPVPSFPDYVAMHNRFSPNQIMAMVHTDDRLRRLTPQQIVNNMRVAQQELDYVNATAKPVQFKGYFIGDCKIDKGAFLSQRLTTQYIYDACGKPCSDVLHPPPTRMQLIESEVVKYLVFGVFPLLILVGNILIRTRTILRENRRTTFGDIIGALILTLFLVGLTVGASSVAGGWPFAILFLGGLAFIWSGVITGITDDEREWGRLKAKQEAEEQMKRLRENRAGGAGS